MSPPRLPVLIVDDQPAVVEALELLLDIHGIPCVAAAGPAEAREIAANENLGAVVQDMNFVRSETSGEQGVALFRALRDLQPGVPILLMTAWASLETAVELVKEGAADYLEKPWNDDKLVATVRNLRRMRQLDLENERLRAESTAAREALEDRYDLRGLVYRSGAMQRVVSLAVSVAESDAPVLVSGANGSGKERIAEIIQANSRRRDRPFVRVNVGAIPEELMESELFGAEAGAYTGSTARRIGHFETADGGTLFLDEIDALPLAGQVKLLRVLQSGEFQRLGSSRTRRADVRVLSATNARLDEEIAAGRFREDLFFRLNVVEVAMPPLADRPDDVLALAEHFLEHHGDPGAGKELSAAAETALLEYDWPGNVRELENRIQRALLVEAGPEIGPAALGFEADSDDAEAAKSAAALSDEEAEERRRVVAAISEAGGIVSRAAARLGISRQALYRKMSRLSIQLERRTR